MKTSKLPPAAQRLDARRRTQLLAAFDCTGVFLLPPLRAARRLAQTILLLRDGWHPGYIRGYGQGFVALQPKLGEAENSQKGNEWGFVAFGHSAGWIGEGT